LNQAKREYAPEHIFNFDETCWKRLLGPNKVLAEKGTESVKLKTVKGEKESYTASGSTSAAGTKMPFWILAKGKTDLCHTKVNARDDVMVRHTQSAGTNEEIMLEYLQWPSNQAQREPILLVLDCAQPIEHAEYDSERANWTSSSSTFRLEALPNSNRSTVGSSANSNREPG
jgi:hypothetical protein